MKILVAPGAFKHSLTAAQAADAIIRGLERSGLAAEFVRLPLADGGNGTLDAFLARGGERLSMTVHDPLGRMISSAYGLIDDGKTAVIEMALASGLELVEHEQLTPLEASTYGTGELLRAALESGAQRFIIGMGGSATTDGGAGALQALGLRLLDINGHPIPCGGGGLAALHTLDTSGLSPRWREVEVIIASDVDHPAVGAEGAAAIFAPQKGASPEQVQQLEANLQHYFGVIATQTGVDVRQTRGAGAAGAFAGGVLALLGGRIQSGLDLLLAHHDFERELMDASLVITGEGRLDSQSIRGKTPVGIARRAQAAGIPVVALVGGLQIEEAVLRETGIHVALPILSEPMTLADALSHATALLERTAYRLGSVLQLNMRQKR